MIFGNAGKNGFPGLDPDWKESGRKIGSAIKKLLLVFGGFLVVMAVAFGSHFTLTEEQYGVVYTFGIPRVAEKAGWNWKIPVIQKVKTLPKTVLGMPIGYEAGTDAVIESESIMITQDFNFLDVDFYIEYRVSDPIKALNHEATYYDIIRNLAQSYIRDTIGTHNVDSVLTTGKTEIENEIETKLRDRLVEEDIGYSIENVLMQDADQPTEEVKLAFSNVENAKQSMDTKVNEGNQYQNTKIPEAEAKADKLIRDAEAEKQARINEANGEVAKFNAMYEEYRKYPLITKKRMLYETFEELLPNLKVYITNGTTETVLPLDQFSSVQVNGESVVSE